MRLAAPLLLLLAAAGPPPAELDLTLEGLRSQRGTVRLCLTRSAAYFPDCSRDPRAVRRNVPADHAAHIRIGGIAAGRYAVSIVHDENDNGRLDRFLMIPREGFGFSRNPRLRMGPPRFDETLISIGDGPARERIVMKYMM